MKAKYAVVDLFAGPGGLAEGFASVRVNGVSPFSIVQSVEKEDSAHATLLLRSFLRQFGGKYPREYYQFLNGEIPEPDWGRLYPIHWKAASAEALKLELGTRTASAKLDGLIDGIRKKHGRNIVLIGGPPCQAYSLVGRARNKGIEGYEASADKRHFLYREYIRILKRLQPAAFVMENVKGMLSSSVDGERIFDKVLGDLRSVGEGEDSYEIVTVAPRRTIPNAEKNRHPFSAEFVVRAEDFGVPQARHRVIVVGIRKSLARPLGDDFFLKGLLAPNGATPVTVRDVLGGMPRLRSGLSKADDATAWKKVVEAAIDSVVKLELGLSRKDIQAFRARARHYALTFHSTAPRSRAGKRPMGLSRECPDKLRRWLNDPSLKHLPNNETRSHMVPDLARYFFAALFGEVMGVSPKASDFPPSLAPKHRNWETGKFADRFRAQLWDLPSTTITSHISKEQCRSLTVREAARLQTFPDNYFFKGNRTQQFVQVGNAVPPYLAKLIAESLYRVLAQGIERKKANTTTGLGQRHKNSMMQSQVATATT
jgi:DNA (cytosine-5)-methyltransferase 1